MENKQSPKERFLSRVDIALQEFEHTTGVEVHNIKIVRVDMFTSAERTGEHAGLVNKTVPSEWRVTLR